MPEDQVKFAILKGMKNSLRKEIVNHAPTTVDEIRRWGCIAEAGEVGDKDSTSSTTAMLKQIQDRLDALQVQQTSVAPYTHNKPSFSNQQRYNVDPNQQYSSTWQNTNNQRRWSNGRGFSSGRGGGGRGRGWSRSSGSAVSFGRGRGTFTPQQQETFGNNNVMFDVCTDVVGIIVLIIIQLGVLCVTDAINPNISGPCAARPWAPSHNRGGVPLCGQREERNITMWPIQLSDH